MASNILDNGTDLDTLFAAHVTSNSTYATGYQVIATDIQTRYDVLSAPNIVNAGARIPAIGILTSNPSWSANTDLATIFCGNAGQYSLTTPTGAVGSLAGFTSPTTITYTCTITFASASALTNYFNYGGRIQLACTQTGGSTAADTALAAMFSAMGTIIIYDAGHYQSGGSSGTITNSTVGGSNIGTTATQLFTMTDGTPYTGSGYTVSMVANAASGSATVLTITTVLTMVTSGSAADSYTGTYTSNIQQRNHPSQSVPTFSHTGPTAVGPSVVTITISADINDFNAYNNRTTSQHGASVTISGTYVAGSSAITVVVNSGIYVGSTTSSTYGFDTGTGWNAADTLALTNSGYITGFHGVAGTGVLGGAGNPGLPGAPALRAQKAISITNAAGYIFSGGGGGGAGGGLSYTHSSTPAYSAGYAGGLGAGGTANKNTAGVAAIYGGAGGALGANGVNAVPAAGGGGGGGGGASGGAGKSWGFAGGSGGGHGVAINGISNVSWVSGNTRVYGGTV
jgi:hypothetical protein